MNVESTENHSTIRQAVSTQGDKTEITEREVHPLPSSRFRFSKWNDIDKMNVTSDMLKSPRVRQAPKGYNEFTVELMEQQKKIDTKTKFRLTNVEKKQRQSRTKISKNTLENWEYCENVNLSYQDLGHPYQSKEFMKVLGRLTRCETIQLMDNSLSDLRNIVFPRCKELYLQRNNFISFKKLPQMVSCVHLSLQQNHIESLKDINCQQMNNIKSLVLQDNPVTLLLNYRARVFQLLPNLTLLDYLPRQQQDLQDIEELSARTINCTIS